MMQLGAEGVFVGSGIFKSKNPQKRADAIVKAVSNFKNAEMIADLSADLGEAMTGINEQELNTSLKSSGGYADTYPVPGEKPGQSGGGIDKYIHPSSSEFSSSREITVSLIARRLVIGCASLGCSVGHCFFGQ